MLSTDIRYIDAISRRSWTYQINDVRKWRSYGDDVLAGRPWAGDCSDLASTVLDLLGRRGMALTQRFRLLVTAADVDGPAPNHMVAAVLDDLGAFWIVGDTYAPMYPAAEMDHAPFAYNRLDEIAADNEPTWRDGLPWLA